MDDDLLKGRRGGFVLAKADKHFAEFVKSVGDFKSSNPYHRHYDVVMKNGETLNVTSTNQARIKLIKFVDDIDNEKLKAKREENRKNLRVIKYNGQKCYFHAWTDHLRETGAIEKHALIEEEDGSLDTCRPSHVKFIT